MKYEKLIDRIDKLYPNDYSTEEKLSFIDTVNADIEKNIVKSNSQPRPAELEGYTAVPSPYEDLYIYYILSQIAFYQRDYEAYSQYISLYAARYNDYMAYFIRANGGDHRRLKNWMV